MATTITAGNATNGLAFSADGTGILELKTGTGSGTTAVTISTAQVVNFANAPTGGGMLTSGTAVASTSGTSIDFTGIPSWTKRITVMFNGVSTSGTSQPLIQIGSGSVTVTGYVSHSLNLGSTPAGSSSTIGFNINTTSAACVSYGQIVLALVSSNIWSASGSVTNTTQNGALCNGGSPNLSGALDRVRITTVNGTDTFDAGSINILWE